ncbi:MAG: hypothetical protein ACLGJB_05260 [Blastocatellia bacterium]
MAEGKSNSLLGASLTYYIFEGVLVGVAGSSVIHIFSLSGGGGGSKKYRPTAAGNNPYMEGLKTSGSGAKHHHGGPVPPGRYVIHPPENHPHLGRAARLEPDKRNNMMGRDAFYIHGRGPHGSDGCIVPLTDFDNLMSALARDGSGVLYVEEAMGGDRFA